MILESLIKDESKLTLHCAMATMARGDTITVEDKHWKSPEVQGAIKLGYVRLVGDPPVLPEEVAKAKIEDEETKMFVNVSPSKIAFEIVTDLTDDVGEPIRWKEYAEPNGGALYVPLSLVNDNQIQNALSWGLLSDPDRDDREKVEVTGTPAELEELTQEDICSSVTKPSRKKRSKKAKKSKRSKRAKAKTSANSGSKKGNSEVPVPTEEPETVQNESSNDVGDVSFDDLDLDDVGGFMDIFGIEPEKESGDALAVPDDEEF